MGLQYERLNFGIQFAFRDDRFIVTEKLRKSRREKRVAKVECSFEI